MRLKRSITKYYRASRLSRKGKEGLIAVKSIAKKMINLVLHLLPLRYGLAVQSETYRTGVIRGIYIGIENRLLCITYLRYHKGKLTWEGKKAQECFEV